MNYLRKGPNTFTIVIYLIFGIYFISQPFQFFQIPDSASLIEPWIIFIGGILIIIGAINYFRVRRRVY